MNVYYIRYVYIRRGRYTYRGRSACRQHARQVIETGLQQHSRDNHKAATNRKGQKGKIYTLSAVTIDLRGIFKRVVHTYLSTHTRTDRSPTRRFKADQRSLVALLVHQSSGKWRRPSSLLVLSPAYPLLRNVVDSSPGFNHGYGSVCLPNYCERCPGQWGFLKRDEGQKKAAADAESLALTATGGGAGQTKGQPVLVCHGLQTRYGTYMLWT